MFTEAPQRERKWRYEAMLEQGALNRARHLGRRLFAPGVEVWGRDALPSASGAFGYIRRPARALTYLIRRRLKRPT